MVVIGKEAWSFFMSEDFCIYRTALAVFGALYLLKKLLSLVWTLWQLVRTFVLTRCGLAGVDLKKYGEWAVVTGASEGIGRAYALELAKRGLNVVIMSRSEEKLQKVEKEIDEKYKCEVRAIAVDFSSGQDIYDEISYKLSGLDIGVLVNNVGIGYDHPEYLTSVPAQILYRMVEVNCQTLVQMTHLILPRMVEKKKGVIINLSSAAGDSPIPLLNVYSASKVFVNYFSEIVQKEYKSKGIIVQNVSPFFVTTALSKIRKPNMFVPSPSSFVRSALATVGVASFTQGYWSHALQYYVIQAIPETIVKWLTWNSLVSIRAKAIRKKEKQKRED